MDLWMKYWEKKVFFCWSLFCEMILICGLLEIAWLSGRLLNEVSDTWKIGGVERQTVWAVSIIDFQNFWPLLLLNICDMLVIILSISDHLERELPAVCTFYTIEIVQNCFLQLNWCSTFNKHLKILIGKQSKLISCFLL